MGVSYKIIAALRICGKYVAFRSVSFTFDNNSLQALQGRTQTAARLSGLMTASVTSYLCDPEELLSHILICKMELKSTT